VTVSKPLVAKDSDEQLFRVSAVANWADPNASIKVFSVDSEGKKTTDHASCLVKFFDCKSAGLEWKRIAYLVQRSIDRLQESADKGESHRIKRGMVYKLFRSLVDYDDNYKSIEEVILDSDQNEATALVRFQAPRGDFHRNPFWIDSFGHLSGFVMNASDAIDSRDQVYINHGWDSMRCLKKFSPDVTYRTYVRMQPWQNSLWAGDVYIFGDEGIVAVFGGVKVGCPFSVLSSPAWANTNLQFSSSNCRARFLILFFRSWGLQRLQNLRDPPRCKLINGRQILELAKKLIHALLSLQLSQA
jgi:naphtho-gamma-pyrone polyketide synthase